MNPNAIYDAKTKTVLLQFTYIQCDLDCKPPYSDCCSQQYLGHEAPSLFQISSADGLSWSRCTCFLFHTRYGALSAKHRVLVYYMCAARYRSMTSLTALA
jgi:hypothetical protein